MEKNREVIKIGVFGTDILNMNKGVSALGISLIKVIEDVCSNIGITCQFFLFENSDSKAKDLLHSVLKISRDRVFLNNLSFKNIKDIINLNKKICSFDFVVDITGGDSFSDIYGKKWMLRSSLVKILTLVNKRKLILAPQTYGPFKSKFAKKIATYIIDNSYSVMSRDRLSLDEISKLTQRNVELSTDVAFILPYKRNEIEGKKKKIGINISQLLWSGGYTANNQFGLSLDYRNYILGIINEVIKRGDYEIFLVPHVVRLNKKEKVDFIENDLIACEEVASEYESFVNVAPIFEDPIEAKGFISGMDMFIGSRMHATIAAFSVNIPTIPIAYSRKFEGLFANLNYEYVVDATKVTTNEAINLTLGYISNVEELEKATNMSRIIIDNNIEKIYNDFSKVLIGDRL